MPSKPRCLMSLPGAKEQLWHVDGEHLYTSEPNLACYGSTQQVRQYLHNCCLHRHTLYTFIGQHHHHNQYIVIRISFSKTTRRYCPRTASTSSSPWSTLRSWSPTSRINYFQIQDKNRMFSGPQWRDRVLPGQSFPLKVHGWRYRVAGKCLNVRLLEKPKLSRFILRTIAGRSALVLRGRSCKSRWCQVKGMGQGPLHMISYHMILYHMIFYLSIY